MPGDRTLDSADPTHVNDLPQAARPRSIDLSAVDPRFHDRVNEAITQLTTDERQGDSWVVTPLPGGASNLNFRVDTGGKRYAMRVSGGDLERRVSGGTRAHGSEIQRAVAAGGVSVPLHAYALPEGHMLVDFVDNARPLDAEALRDGDLIERVARLVRRLHELPPVSNTWSALDDIHHYRGVADRERLRLAPDVDELEEAAATIDRLTSSVPGSLGMCHNDLQIQNFLFADSRLVLVDWEWAGMGNRYFDLGAVLVNANCNDRDAERFCRAYFGDDVDLDAELARAALMALVSAVREALWSVAAGPVLPNDWDYDAWADTYFDRARNILHSSRFSDLMQTAAPKFTR